MTEWTAKRFWQEARPAAAADGFEVHLDGRPVRTPAKAPLRLPTAPLAEAVAAEWDAQEEVIDPGAMPMTRMANAALDKVAVQRAEVADLIAAYGETDLICYRADGPEALVARQAAAWDPLVAWAREALSAPLTVGTGVMFIPQAPASMAALSARVRDLDHWELAAVHDLVALPGSLVIGLAAMGRVWDRADLWARSRVDETWQAEQWGEDYEAAEADRLRREAFLDAGRFFDLRQKGGERP
jgi:chaperone required for assembly of F1-ATPase